MTCTTAYCCHTDKCLRLLVFHKSLLNFLLFYTCKQCFHHLIKHSSNFANSSSAIQDPWSLVISLGTRLPRSTLHKGRSYASKYFVCKALNWETKIIQLVIKLLYQKRWNSKTGSYKDLNLESDRKELSLWYLSMIGTGCDAFPRCEVWRCFIKTQRSPVKSR